MIHARSGNKQNAATLPQMTFYFFCTFLLLLSMIMSDFIGATEYILFPIIPWIILLNFFSIGKWMSKSILLDK